MNKTFVKPKDMPQEAFDVWEKVYKSNKDKGEESASKIAWSAVKRGWKKEGEKWIRKTASEIKLPNSFRGSTTDLAGLNLDPTSNDTSTIEIMKIGEWHHPIYGDVEITMERLERFAQNFQSGLRKAVAVDVEHKSDEGAVGWFKRVFIQGESLMAEVEWTKEGIQLIRNKKYRFFSPEFSESYEDSATGAEYKDVIIGGAITNRPFFQELEEVVLSDKTITSIKSVIDRRGGEMKMSLTKEELKAKLLENPEFVPAEADGVDEATLTAVKEEIKTEADKKDEKPEEKKEEDKEPEKEEDKKDKEGGEPTVEANEKGDKTVKMSENQLKKLEFAANEGVKAMRELRSMKMAELVKGFTYSQTNSDGVILPKHAEKVQKFMETLGDKQRENFVDILKALPKIRIFGEIGSSKESDEPISGDVYAELNRRALKLKEAEPEKYKEYREAAFEAEKQMKAEGITF